MAAGPAETAQRLASNTALVLADAGDVARFHQLDEAANAYIDAGVAKNTRRAFQGALRGFSDWCASVGVRASPADVETVSRYLAARAPQLAASTLAVHLSALNFAARSWPRQLGGPLQEPGRHPDIKALMKGVRRTHGRPPNQKRGLSGNDLKRALKRLPSSLAGLRDRAILLLGWAAALRRSELAALAIDAGDVRAIFVAEGLVVHVRRSKGDQEGKGGFVPVPYGREVCPVAALRSWIDASGYVAGGPLFRPIDRHGRILESQLTDRSIARIIKAAAGSIGLDPRHFSGHSLRRGPLTAMSNAGASPEQLRKHARHAKVETTLIYVEEAQRFAKSAARMNGL